MSFINFYFLLLFFPLFLLCYYLTNKNIKLQNVVLLIACMIFYASYGIKSILYIVLSITITYIVGIILEKIPNHKKIITIAGCIANIGILVVVKYCNFIIKCSNMVLKPLSRGFPIVDIAVPIGISFFVLQSTTYLISVSKGEMKACKNLINYAVFVSFFPTVVSGPIQRAKKLLPQIENKREMTWEKAKKAALLFVMGAFMKLMIANRLAKYNDIVFTNNDASGAYGMYLILAVICYSIQLYTDFAGYSNMAIAVAMLLGFDIDDNFNRPYMATGIADFWRRWHISLSGWLRDYVYIPLGGNRKGKLRKYINIFVVFIISGLWHGASIGYVVWGMLHGIFQVISGCTLKIRCRITDILHINRNNIVYKAWQRVIVFVLVSFTWIFFRFGSVSDGITFLKKICRVWNPEVLVNGELFSFMAGYHWIIALVSIAIMEIISHIGKWKIIECISKKKDILTIVIIVFLFFVLTVFGVYGPNYSAGSFIYAGF